MADSEFDKFHKPVLLEELLEALSPRENGLYLDGTLGVGGHSRVILQAAAGSQICGLDQDAEALALAQRNLSEFGSRARIFHMRYSEFAKALKDLGWQKLDGAILDLGVSSLQLDTPERGFSFRANGSLDMRMDQQSGRESAKQLVNRGSYDQLRDCIATLGEEPMAGRIARQIVDARQKEPIEDTERLAEIVCGAYPRSWRGKSRKHPATRVFQALRMAVNDELGQLRLFLSQIYPWLADGGRLVVISFHSLEDRMVKHAMRALAKGLPWPGQSDKDENHGQALILYKKPVLATPAELAANPRASSAKLRALEKISG